MNEKVAVQKSGNVSLNAVATRASTLTLKILVTIVLIQNGRFYGEEKPRPDFHHGHVRVATESGRSTRPFGLLAL